MKNCSEQLNELFAALSKAQSEMQTAGLNQKNPFFKSKYADLTEIIKVTRPALTKNNLSVIQQIDQTENGQIVMLTILGHASGQWIASQMPILPQKSDVQSLGSYLTYLSRYSYSRLICVAIGDEDDDGEGAIESRSYNAPVKEVHKEANKISKEQHDDLQKELVGHQDLAKAVLNKLNLDYLIDMEAKDFLLVKNYIVNAKNKKNEAKNLSS